MKRTSPSKLLFILLLLLPLCLLLGLIIGPQIILPFLADSAQTYSNQLIVEQIRLPRTLLAGIIGATLAVAGVMMQGLFRNPLADPSLIGVTSGASAGASFMIVMGAGLFGASELLGVSFVAFGAFLGAACATWLVYRLAPRWRPCCWRVLPSVRWPGRSTVFSVLLPTTRCCGKSVCGKWARSTAPLGTE
jgi:iron complex transport system permease protein